jgi:hypothetical protein
MRTKIWLNIMIIFTVLLGAACTPRTNGAAATETPDDLPPLAALNAARALSATTATPVEEIKIISWERREWPDACLGLPQEDEMCAQVITPGWVVVLRDGVQEHIYRTDDTGENIRPEQSPIVLDSGITIL